jgi:hypothetical protein
LGEAEAQIWTQEAEGEAEGEGKRERCGMRWCVRGVEAEHWHGTALACITIIDTIIMHIHIPHIRRLLETYLFCNGIASLCDITASSLILYTYIHTYIHIIYTHTYTHTHIHT